MKKRLMIIFCIVILVLIICFLILKKDNHGGEIMDGPGMVNDVSSYSVDVKERWESLGEDVYVYDNNGNLVLSLDDENQSQYLYVLYGDFIVLDSGTSASQREMLVYDIPSGKLVYETDYYPGEKGLVLNDDVITFYKRIDDSLLSEYTLPQCENGYDNGYIENYGYTIGEDQANDLGDLQCAYFE